MNKYIKYDNNSKTKWFNNIPLAKPKTPLYVIDWHTEGNNYYSIGISNNTLYKHHIKVIKSGLFVWALDYDELKNLLINIVPTLTIININNIPYRNNNCHVFDSICNSTRYQKNWKLYKIETQSFAEASRLYGVISKNEQLSYLIGVTGQWNLSTFITLEMHIRNKDYIYCIFIDDNLEYNTAIDYLIDYDTVIFDIEVVSSLDHRLPYGNFINDHMMSVTIVVNKKLYTLFNLPLTDEAEISKAMTFLENTTDTNYTNIETREVMIYTNESDLINKLLSILENIQRPYICIGYNSRGYDMPYLLTRSIYLNLPRAKNFLFINGIVSYGTNMIHIDLNQVLVKYLPHELQSFKLKNVARDLLDDDTQKVDFDARNLRYIYKYIKDNNHINNGYFSNTMVAQLMPWEVNLSTLASYNEMDCLVVLEIWTKLQFEAFIQYSSRNFFLPLVRTTLSKLNEYLSGNMIFEGLKQDTLFAFSHSRKFINNDKLSMVIDSDNIAALNEKGSYGGGFNFRNKKHAYDLVHAMDAAAYYPSTISGMNLSHETASIIPISDLKIMIDHCDNTFDPANYTFTKFCTHKSINEDVKHPTSLEKLDQTIAPFAYINEHVKNCEILNIDDIKRNTNTKDKLIIIYTASRGVLAEIIERRNRLRNIAKSSKKKITTHVKYIKDILQKLPEPMELDDSDEKMKEELKISDIRNVRKSHEPEEDYLVNVQLLLLPEAHFEIYNSKRSALSTYLSYLNIECIRINSHYRNMKLLNNSVYGLLGASYGTIKAKLLAAIVTMMGRKYIIESARTSNKTNTETVYCDTDSIYCHIKNPYIHNPVEYIIESVNKLKQHVVLNVEEYTHVLILGRKTYIYIQDNKVHSRGISKNGPHLWKKWMDKFYIDYIVNKQPLTEKNVSDILMEMYIDTYNEIQKEPSSILQTTTIQERDAYKKEIPVTHLIDRINNEYKSYTFGNKITYFYKLIDDISNIHYAMDFELVHTAPKDINIYKFYSSMSTTYYNILSYAIERTMLNEYGIVLKYPIESFRTTNKITYLKFINQTR